MKFQYRAKVATLMAILVASCGDVQDQNSAVENADECYVKIKLNWRDPAALENKTVAWQSVSSALIRSLNKTNLAEDRYVAKGASSFSPESEKIIIWYGEACPQATLYAQQFISYLEEDSKATEWIRSWEIAESTTSDKEYNEAVNVSEKR